MLSLLLEWGYKPSTGTNFVMMEPVDLLQFHYSMEDEMLGIKPDEALIRLINKLDSDPGNVIKVRITGHSNAVMNSTGTIEIPVIVKSLPVNLRFELY